jgi:two-component system NtrC family response regulator
MLLTAAAVVVGSFVILFLPGLALSRAFVDLNCAAVPAALLETELFGYEPGAFTGATTEKPGLVEVADGGTLFLDEVGEMATEVQSKLLRILDMGTFYRVGATRKRRADFRLVAATNLDPGAEVAALRISPRTLYRWMKRLGLE